MNRAEARIDVDRLASNIALLKSTSKTDLMAVVKADAYGHGLLGVGLSAEKAGADWLGVALLEEAIKLRTHGVRIPILAWLVSPGSDFKSAVDHDIDIAVASIAAFKEIAALPNKPRIHIELDTGMTRGGFLDEWQEFLKQDFSTVNVVGVFSHFARADEPEETQNAEQLHRFNSIVADLAEIGINPAI
jgi:alanine racemase